MDWSYHETWIATWERWWSPPLPWLFRECHFQSSMCIAFHRQSEEATEHDANDRNVPRVVKGTADQWNNSKASGGDGRDECSPHSPQRTKEAHNANCSSGCHHLEVFVVGKVDEASATNRDGCIESNSK